MLARLAVAVLSLVSIFVAAESHAAGSLAPQSSKENGVTVQVTPRPIASDGSVAFDIVLDTHTRELSEDLLKSVILVADGQTHMPTGWKGDGPGGHHRKGVLTFGPISPRPAKIELKLQRPGEAAPRVFQWTTR